jgi:two-component system LytT family sensor kinase
MQFQTLKETFIITFCCAFYSGTIITLLYGRVNTLPRVLFFTVFVALVFTGVVLGVGTAFLILTGEIRLNRPTLLFSLIFGLVSSASFTLYEVFKSRLEEKITRLKAAELENEQLKRYEAEARMASLQAKLNPHFLFNTLNSMASLIYDDPKKVEKSIIRLSDLYRKVLSISDQTFIPIREEIELIRDYLELEQLRFDEQLSYHIQCPPRIQDIKVPGLIIEPLVENVIKHTQEHSEAAVHIDIRVEQENDSIQCTVRDNGPGFNVRKTSFGFGLYSVQERLRLLFQEQQSLDIRSEPGKGTTVTVRFPVKR